MGLGLPGWQKAEYLLGSKDRQEVWNNFIKVKQADRVKLEEDEEEKEWVIHGSKRGPWFFHGTALHSSSFYHD